MDPTVLRGGQILVVVGEDLEQVGGLVFAGERAWRIAPGSLQTPLLAALMDKIMCRPNMSCTYYVV